MLFMGQEYTGKKTSVLTNLIASVCIVVYIAALSYGALLIYNSVHERLSAGEQEYTNLADLASAAGVLGFMNEPFIRTIEDAIAGSQSILGVIISGPNGEYAFERNKGTVITWVNNSPRFKHPFGVSNPPHYMPLRIEGQRNVSIQVATGYIDYEFCIGILKRVLLAVLAALTLAFLTLLMEALLMRNRMSGEAPEGREQPPESEAQATDESQPLPPPDDNPDSEDGETQPADSQDDDSLELPPEEEDEGSPDIDFSFIDEQEAPAQTEAPEQAEPPARQKQPDPARAPSLPSEPRQSPDSPGEEPGPRGLFSPRGNIGWEEYTADRLEAELHRCASGEQDLVFIAMEFNDALDSRLYRELASDTVEFFTHRDLIFEKGDRGISIILPNVDLDQGFAQSKELLSRILNKHSEVFGSESGLCIGLSSRSGRLIDAERLMFETFQALKKALHDPVSRIVAFKSDPEKYREFIRNKNQGNA
jgi:hypothetical protein